MNLPALPPAFFLLASVSALAAEIPSQRVEFDKGSTGTELAGKITGRDSMDYQLDAKAGQTMRVTLEAGTPSICFNLLPPGGAAALHVGSREGTEFNGRLPADGDYTVRIYLMGNARDADLTVPYKLKLSIDADPPAAAGFDRRLELQGVGFRVTTSTDDTGKVLLRVNPDRLEIDNSAAEQAIEGSVTGAEVADLNADGSPELYVYLREPGDAARGRLLAWSTNKGKSMSEVFMPQLARDDPKLDGYHGHDEFAVVEGTLVRRFPVSSPEAKERKWRQLQYKLEAGEAGWLLRLDRAVDY
jgi:hypothetical protein